MADLGSSLQKETYDQAKNHFKGNYPDSLPIEQAYLHIGMYLGWIIQQHLYSSFFEEEAETQMIRFQRNELSCIILSEIWDGYLGAELLNEEAIFFSREYYLSGKYLSDYQETLAGGLPSFYHVADTRENFQLIAKKLNERFCQWKGTII